MLILMQAAVAGTETPDCESRTRDRILTYICSPAFIRKIVLVWVLVPGAGAFCALKFGTEVQSCMKAVLIFIMVVCLIVAVCILFDLDRFPDISGAVQLLSDTAAAAGNGFEKVADGVARTADQVAQKFLQIFE